MSQYDRVVLIVSIVLPALRALHDIYGPVSVIHFDSHCDSRQPTDNILTHGVSRRHERFLHFRITSTLHGKRG